VVEIERGRGGGFYQTLERIKPKPRPSKKGGRIKLPRTSLGQWETGEALGNILEQR